MAISAGQAVVDILRAENVKYVFGMPGGHTIGIYEALYHSPDIRHVLVRHEQHAANMAAGYAQLTGEPGVCCVTAGPGATNLITGITEAFVGALPIIILAGRGATRNAHKGASQEIDQVQMFRPITKWAVRVDRADLIPEVLRQAFVIARSGKPGPVLIDIPQDVLVQAIELDRYQPAGLPPRVRGDLDLVKKAAALLAVARRPLIVSGGGAIAAGASDAVRALAEKLSIPVLTTLSGRGIIPDDHPLAAGGIGHHRTTIAKKLLPEADVVIGIGCRFEQQETNWLPSYLPDPNAAYIQIDLDPVELGRSVVPKVGIVGDARLVVEDIVSQLTEMSATVRDEAVSQLDALDKMRAALEAEIGAMVGSAQSPIHPVRVIDAVRRAFPRETTVVIDVGVLAQGMGGAFPYFKVYEPRSLITPSSFYGMGFASSALPAAQLARPDCPAVSLVGDGSFQMIMNVLPTAAELRSGVTWVVLNDEALGSIRDIQRLAFNERYIATEFEVQPDFAKVAEACGCYGERVEDPGEIDAALRRAREVNSRGIPAVLDFAVAKERLDGSLEFFKR
ncbi:MAG TPA: thiamine pyrophosphate-binding protein [Xanthobacteraceae bacterium]|nr:thiamine pyrophosphate-binding protein [Xanthobacteraceae bacterium]